MYESYRSQYMVEKYFEWVAAAVVPGRQLHGARLTTCMSAHVYDVACTRSALCPWASCIATAAGQQGAMAAGQQGSHVIGAAMQAPASLFTWLHPPGKRSKPLYMFGVPAVLQP